MYVHASPLVSAAETKSHDHLNLFGYLHGQPNIVMHLLFIIYSMCGRHLKLF